MSRTCIISPCSRLNGVVLREIFIHCIIHHHHDPFIDYYPKKTSRRFLITTRDYKPSVRNHPQLSVSQVCSSWRDIALITPQLWDNIHIADLTEANLSTAREYLLRAGNFPVSIHISDLSQPQDSPWQDLHSLVIDFLSSYRIRSLALIADRVTRMSLSSRFINPVRILSALPQRSVEELESLVIYGHPDKEAEMDLNDTRYPKLALVRIADVSKISSLNSSSLRIFDGTRLSMTVNEIWDLLSHCSLLEESWLRITPVNSSGELQPVSMPQIHLQRLRILVLIRDMKSPSVAS